MDYLLTLPEELKVAILSFIPVDNNDLDGIIEAHPEMIALILSKNYWIDRFRDEGFGEWNDWVLFPKVKHNLDIFEAKNKLLNYKYIYTRIYRCIIYTREIYTYMITDLPPHLSGYISNTEVTFVPNTLSTLNLLDLLDISYNQKLEIVKDYNQSIGKRRYHDQSNIYVECDNVTKKFTFSIGTYQENKHPIEVKWVDIEEFVTKALFLEVKIFDNISDEDSIILALDNIYRA